MKGRTTFAPHWHEEFLTGNSGEGKTTSICFQAHLFHWLLPTAGILSRFSAKGASERVRTTTPEMEGVPVRWGSGRADPASGETRSGPNCPESQVPRAAGLALHHSFGLPGSDRNPTPTPAPHSHSRPEPGPGHGHTCGSFRKRTLQPVAHSLTQPPSSRKSISGPGAGANEKSQALPAPPAT